MHCHLTPLLLIHEPSYLWINIGKDPQSNKYFHELFWFLIAYRALHVLLIFVTVFTGNKVTTLVNVTYIGFFAKLALQASRDLCWKIDLVLEIFKLALTNTLFLYLGSLPDVLYGPVYQQISRHQHSKTDDKLPEGNSVNLFVPERGYFLYDVLRTFQRFKHELRLKYEFFVSERVFKHSIECQVLHSFEAVSERVEKRVLSLILGKYYVRLLLLLKDFCWNIATFYIHRDFLTILFHKKSPTCLTFYKTILQYSGKKRLFNFSVKDSKSISWDVFNLNLRQQKNQLTFILDRTEINIGILMNFSILKLSSLASIEVALLGVLPEEVV